MKIKTALEKIGMVLSLLFIIIFCGGICYLCFTSGDLLTVIFGVVILLVCIGVPYLGLREEISSFISEIKKKKRERKEKKVVQIISEPKVIPRPKKKKETKFKPPISSEPEIEKASFKGEMMRELGLSYEKPEKPKKTENKIEQPSISQFREGEKRRSFQKKKIGLARLQSEGVIQPLIEKGELEISGQRHIGQMRGADIAGKLIRPILREFNIKVSIKYNNHKSTIFLEEREREKLKEEIEKLEG